MQNKAASLLNPFLLFSFLYIILAHSGVVRVLRQTPFYTGLEWQKITRLDGFIESNVYRDGYDFNYSATFCPHHAYSKDNRKSGAGGKIKLIIPYSVIDRDGSANIKGKKVKNSKVTTTFYNKSAKRVRSRAVFEKGIRLTLYGHFIDGKRFLVAKGINLPYGSGIKGKLYDIRIKFRRRISRILEEWGKAGALFLSLLLGVRDLLSESEFKDFQLAGVLHVIALSGLHLSIFNNLSNRVYNKIVGKRAGYILNILTLLAFVFIVGFTPSLLRAFIFYLIIAAQEIFSIKGIDTLQTLSLTLAIHILVAPLDIYRVAFLLSYASLYGILLFSEGVRGLLKNLFPLVIADGLAVSISASIASFPLVAHFFHIIVPIGIIASTIITPLVALFIYVGLVFLVIVLVNPGANVFVARVFNLFYFFIHFIIYHAAECPYIELS